VQLLETVLAQGFFVKKSNASRLGTGSSTSPSGKVDLEDYLPADFISKPTPTHLLDIFK